MHTNLAALAVLAAVESSITPTGCMAIFIASNPWFTATALALALVYRLAMLIPQSVSEPFNNRHIVQRVSAYTNKSTSAVARSIVGYVLLATAAWLIRHDNIRLIACATNLILSILDDAFVDSKHHVSFH